MKNIYYISIILLVISFSSCKEKLDSANVSRTTYYPVMTVLGSSVQLVQMGAQFKDSGAVALANGKSIPVTTTVSGVFTPYTGTTVDVNTPNEYLITYTAVNSDGFAGTASRTVWVAKTGDLVTSIEGLYSSTVVRNGAVNPQYQNLQYVIIWKTGANTYQISDAIGGYYDLGRNYGPAYAATGGIITAASIPGNSFSFADALISGFGGDISFTSMSVDPVGKTISLVTSWAAIPYTFAITLSQVQF